MRPRPHLLLFVLLLYRYVRTLRRPNSLAFLLPENASVITTDYSSRPLVLHLFLRLVRSLPVFLRWRTPRLARLHLVQAQTRWHTCFALDAIKPMESRAVAHAQKHPRTSKAPTAAVFVSESRYKFFPFLRSATWFSFAALCNKKPQIRVCLKCGYSEEEDGSSLRGERCLLSL